MFSKVADLHALSYLHGDLQPDHFRVDNGNTIYLLDLALAHHADEPFDYGGALVHFSPPEICEQQLLGRSPTIYDELAEFYSLASVVFFLYTGQVSSDYESEDMKSLSLEWKRERIAQGHRNSFSSTGCEPFESLEYILEKCLAANRQERYSNVAEAAQAFYTLLSSYN